MKPSTLCPHCENGNAILTTEKVVFDFAGLEIEVNQHYYKCDTCMTEFTTTDTDEATLNQVNK